MPNKGWDILIPLMKILRPRFPGLRFRIIGDLQPLRYAFHRRLHTALRANNLDSWVEFTGFLEPSAVQRLFAAATLAVQPFTEGALLNRTSLLALLLHGVPVVTQPPVRQAEHLRPGWHYAAPAARTAEDYAQTVEILLAQPPEREAFGVRAAELRAVFHWDAIARSMESVIRSVCAHA
jgi:glycosyltransferase involved in cell wall biosynthesis